MLCAACYNPADRSCDLCKKPMCPDCKIAIEGLAYHRFCSGPHPEDPNTGKTLTREYVCCVCKLNDVGRNLRGCNCMGCAHAIHLRCGAIQLETDVETIIACPHCIKKVTTK